MSSRPAPLSPEEEAVWRSLARVMVALPRTLDDDLVARDGLTLTRYVVLMRLSEAPQQSLRMKDLASAVALSPSRMTRVVADLVDEGLVSRGRVEGDARASTARLTAAGRKRLRRAWPSHLAGVREHVISRVAPGDLAHLDRILEALLGEPEGEGLSR